LKAANLDSTVHFAEALFTIDNSLMAKHFSDESAHTNYLIIQFLKNGLVSLATNEGCALYTCQTPRQQQKSTIETL